MRRGPATSLLLALTLGLGSCAGPVAEAPESTVADPTVADDPVEWVPCGAIQCGNFTVPVDHLGGEQSAGVLTLRLFRRSSTTDNAPVLLLVGDRLNPDRVDATWGARALAERAELMLGTAARGFDVISVALRGSAEMPMPPGTEAIVGTLDVADDLELLRTEGLGSPRVRVLGWGDGATAVAAWVMRRPSAIGAAVLDSPADPAASLRTQSEAHIIASDAAADWAVKWCASHLSCPVNATPANTLELLDARIDDGSAPEGITRASLARAAEVALAGGSPNSLWNAITEAADRRGDRLAGLAGRPPSEADVRSLCRDTGSDLARTLVTLHGAARPKYFTVGPVAERLVLCLSSTAPARPLGQVEENPGAVGAPVMVTGSASDPVRPASIMRAMAERNKWKWEPSPAVRHLVVGREEVPTSAAMAHLRGD